MAVIFVSKKPDRSLPAYSCAALRHFNKYSGGVTNGKKCGRITYFLFDEILPSHGMTLRVKQKELSLEMLRALQEDKLALCEAEVGTGKTHAYILALTVHNLYSDKKTPAVISTSTIALQKALTEEYIPQISGILLEHHVIDRPLSCVVRKGKSIMSVIPGWAYRKKADSYYMDREQDKK